MRSAKRLRIPQACGTKYAGILKGYCEYSCLPDRQVWKSF